MRFKKKNIHSLNYMIGKTMTLNKYNLKRKCDNNNYKKKECLLQEKKFINLNFKISQY
jgi:hypothetical protein